MTVGEALARAEELRPGCQITARTRQRWLVELDGMLREKRLLLYKRNSKGISIFGATKTKTAGRVQK